MVLFDKVGKKMKLFGSVEKAKDFLNFGLRLGFDSLAQFFLVHANLENIPTFLFQDKI